MVGPSPNAPKEVPGRAQGCNASTELYELRSESATQQHGGRQINNCPTQPPPLRRATTKPPMSHWDQSGFVPMGVESRTRIERVRNALSASATTPICFKRHPRNHAGIRYRRQPNLYRITRESSCTIVHSAGMVPANSARPSAVFGGPPKFIRAALSTAGVAHAARACSATSPRRRITSSAYRRPIVGLSALTQATA